MEAPFDLYRARREEVVALVVRQREQIADLEQEVTRQRGELATQRAEMRRLTERVGTLLAVLEPPDGDDAAPRPTPMPGLKPAGRTWPPAPPRARTRRPHGYGRKRLMPTARQVHGYAQCPSCRTALGGGTVRRTREVLELVPARIAVAEHVSIERRCPRCRGRWLPGSELAGVVVGQGRLGVGLLSRIAVLREEVRLPVDRIQWDLAAMPGLRLSVGPIVGALHTVAACAAPLVAGRREPIRASPVLHVDETGWREDGVNGYVWTFSTPPQRAFVRGGRERAVLEQEIGADFAGVLVSDFDAVSTGDEGRHQPCWAHLRRDVAAVVTQHRQDAAVVGWADGIHAIYARAVAVVSADPVPRRHRRRDCEAALGALCAPYGGVAEAPQRVLCERIAKHLHELFVFVEHPEVPPTNNAAERSLRHLVTCRKISCGTRSPAGTATKMTLTTLFGTWRLQGLDPLAECRTLLVQPQL